MRAAFAAGEDIHVATAVWFTPGIRQLPETEQKLPRNKAKAVNYGLPYGMGAETLRRKAWKDYQLDLTFDEIVLSATAGSTPTRRSSRTSRNSTAADLMRSGRLPVGLVARSGSRRSGPDTDELLHPAGELRYTDCCNFGVQASASDLLLDAMAGSIGHCRILW